MAQDIIDAEFVSISPGEASQETAERSGPAKIPVGASSGDDQIAFLKAAGTRNHPSAIMQTGYVSFVVLAAITAFLISGGHVLFKGKSQAAPPMALMLELLDPPSGSKPALGNVMTVSATIRNNSAADWTVPDVLLTFRSEGDNPALIYRVPRGETLKPGKSLAFTVRMPKKPGYGQAPGLRFDNNGV